MELNGSSAIVTGGASGIGEACVRLLAKRGAKVVIADIQEEKGQALAKEVGFSSRTTFYIAFKKFHGGMPSEISYAKSLVGFGMLPKFILC
mgnify:CR=1 FL=1